MSEPSSKKNRTATISSAYQSTGARERFKSAQEIRSQAERLYKEAKASGNESRANQIKAVGARYQENAERASGYTQAKRQSWEHMFALPLNMAKWTREQRKAFNQNTSNMNKAFNTKVSSSQYRR